ncbi:hypothetical protein RJ641_017596 [Dillenia turbinata]|uniref:Uncharacterized protein n=1 Tax=Dillenia turbinata TaxID=194707 RepID=A0AAN8UU32_9MAGN
MAMDFKGIAWVGNVYQKFEAMCLEVEEIMYQDTMKYVESQVHTVGTSVKRFCSDVMQDLLPPSSVEPLKVDGAPFSLENDTDAELDFGLYKKPKVVLKEGHHRSDTKKCSRKLDVTADMGKDVTGASAATVISSCNTFDSDWVKDSKASLIRDSNLSLKKVPVIENPVPVEVSRLTSPVAKDCSCKIPNENSEPEGDQELMSSPNAAAELWEHGWEEAESANGENSNAAENEGDSSFDPVALDRKALVESVENNDMEIRVSSSLSGSSRQAYDMSGNGCLVSLEESSIDGEPQCIKLADKEVIPSDQGQPDDWTADGGENCDSIGHSEETVKFPDLSKLDESCVLVDGNEASVVSPRKGKHSSYKKKIRDALYTKIKLARRKEFEQLRVCYGDNDTNSNSTPPLGMNLDSRKLPAPDSCDFEWELL